MEVEQPSREKVSEELDKKINIAPAYISTSTCSIEKLNRASGLQPFYHVRNKKHNFRLVLSFVCSFIQPAVSHLQDRRIKVCYLFVVQL